MKLRPRIVPTPTVRLRLSPLTTIPTGVNPKHRLTYPLSPVKMKRESVELLSPVKMEPERDSPDIGVKACEELRP